MQTSMDDSGVLILAVGKALYAEYAFNLAGSIKIGNPKIRVAVCISENMKAHPLWSILSKAFDKVVVVPEKITHYKGKLMPGRMKLLMNTFTPFAKTLFMDADSIIFPNSNFTHKLNELLTKDLAYHCWRQYPKHIVEKCGQACVWGPLVPYIDIMGMQGDRFDEVSSYFMYWRTNERNDAFFAKALEIHDGILTGELPLHDKVWNGSDWVPDEYPLTLATGILGTYSNMGIYQPFADLGQKGRDMKMVEKSNVGITLPGNGPNTFWVNWYNHYARKVSEKYGVYKAFTFGGK